MWSTETRLIDEHFFTRLSHQQTPKYFWIGCSDARVPANQIVGLPIGSIFVHRNVGNLVLHTDINCQSALEFAINVLQVEHVIVCGHYSCSAIDSVLDIDSINDTQFVKNWLRSVYHLRMKFDKKLKRILTRSEKCDALCELNVREQVRNVCANNAVQNRWENGDKKLVVHGWIYSVSDGLIRDLGISVESHTDIHHIYKTNPTTAASTEQS